MIYLDVVTDELYKVVYEFTSLHFFPLPALIFTGASVRFTAGLTGGMRLYVTVYMAVLGLFECGPDLLTLRASHT